MGTSPKYSLETISLLPDLDFDLFTGILCIRYAAYIASSNRHFAKDVLKKPLWDMVEKAEPGAYLRTIIEALHQMAIVFPCLNALIASVQTTKPEEPALGETIELFSHIECESISPAQIYEYRLRQEMGKASKLPGDFYIPLTVIHMMLKLLEIREGSVYDPCCGSGAMLWQAFAEHPGLKLYGQAADGQAYKICRMNAFFRDQPINLGKKSADVFAEDLHSNQKFDYILSNPPFNVSKWHSGLYLNDSRWCFGIPPKSNANFAWLQHIISHLSCHGRAAVIMPNGALTTSVRAEQQIRKEVLCAGLVEAIIALPSGLFYNTKVPCSLWLLEQSRDFKETVLLVDARRLRLRGDTEISTQHMERLSELLLRHRTGMLQGREEWYAAVPLCEIAQRDYNLSPNLYTKASCIEIKEIQENQSRFEKMIELISALTEEGELLNSVQQWKNIKPAGKWERAFLLELYEAFGGIAKPKECFGHGAAMVDVKTVIHHFFVPDTLMASVSADSSEMEKYQIKAGDILLNRTSETIEELACGCVSSKDSGCVYSAYVKRLRPIYSHLLNPFYMAGYLRSAIYRQEVKKVSTVYTTRANINMKQLSNIAVYFPELDMQQKLGNTILKVSQFQEESDEKLKALFREFIDLLIERHITYPILHTQNREGRDI